MVRVSVIIPNYNHALYLQQRIDSILDQTYQNFELIILDDCSTDNSKEVIEPFRHHPKISHIIYNKKNSGSTFKQWNRGVGIAKGDWIWIAESDDYSSEFFLEKLVANLDKENTGIIYCDSFYVSEEPLAEHRTQDWKNKIFKTNRWASCYTNSGTDEVNNYMLFHNVIDNVSCALIKKDLYLKAGMADGDFRYAGDWLLYMQICFLTNITYISETLNYFRKHTTNVSRQSDRNGMRSLEKLLCYAVIRSQTGKIRKGVKKELAKEEASCYLDFLYFTIKLNKNITGFLAGQAKLLRKSFFYSFRLWALTLGRKLSIGRK